MFLCCLHYTSKLRSSWFMEANCWELYSVISLCSDVSREVLRYGDDLGDELPPRAKRHISWYIHLASSAAQINKKKLIYSTAQNQSLHINFPLANDTLLPCLFLLATLLLPSCVGSLSAIFKATEIGTSVSLKKCFGNNTLVMCH